ncbi:mechanosensitive ion channel protein MscS [Idiomarina sp. WRN-38]|jgi:small-conductance mechanosensitive channel|uniref:mechanosensitive ion channel family protein n=1 Tax=Idiomarina sp. OXR-189 TaxID=3100175 RepID=UPI000733880A|nr:mechanosensitive ion channel domain-containing protein [Idiomarina sp. OXR-189]KTG24684.1 mechanosensitive ion channel protein MscS [Idiomarina sp. H105]OAE93190.1 mechanosensitive ion channel protein MscS [Idiomarina sp. WRN-38]WPZ01294.1 mechanosensitive ion channel [Idiomarina sp. OXR-189]
METESVKNVAGIFKSLDTFAILEIVIIIAVAVGLVWLTQKLIPWVASHLHGKQRLYTLALVPMLRIVILVLALVMIVPLVIEPTLQNMVAVLGAAGLAIGFALKDYVSSLIAGIVAIHEMPYRPGDWIEVDGSYGEVVHIGMRTVELVTNDDTVIWVPHLKLWDNLIHNANNGGPSLMCITEFYTQPEADAYQIRDALEEVALTSPYLQLGKPIAVTAAEQPWGTKYRLKAYPIDPRQQFQFVTDMTARGKRRLLELGVKFAKVESDEAFELNSP